MGMEFQLHRASVHVAKAYRQVQKAGNAFAKDKVDSGVSHLRKALEQFGDAVNNFANAEEDAYEKAGKLIDDGNKEIEKSIDEFDKGNLDAAQEHFDSALDSFDNALDLID